MSYSEPSLGVTCARGGGPCLRESLPLPFLPCLWHPTPWPSAGLLKQRGESGPEQIANVCKWDGGWEIRKLAAARTPVPSMTVRYGCEPVRPTQK